MNLSCDFTSVNRLQRNTDIQAPNEYFLVAQLLSNLNLGHHSSSQFVIKWLEKSGRFTMRIIWSPTCPQHATNPSTWMCHLNDAIWKPTRVGDVLRESCEDAQGRRHAAAAEAELSDMQNKTLLTCCRPINNERTADTRQITFRVRRTLPGSIPTVRLRMPGLDLITVTCRNFASTRRRAKTQTV